MTEDRTGPNGPRPTAVRRPARRSAPGFGPSVRLRFRPPATLTDTLFAALASGNPDLRMERSAGGDLEIMVPAGGGSSNRNFLLNYRLGQWSENEGRGLGQCFDSSAGFAFPNGAIRSPDASWVARERWEALTPAEKEGFVPLCPDFVAELRSTTDRPAALRRKMREYLAEGARLGWLIDPLTGRVAVYRPDRPVETLERPARLSGENVLPGFVLDLKGVLGD